jgi:hypothetical protein
MAVIHKAVIDRIYRFIRECLSIKFKRNDLRPGSISFVQRCGSLLNLNLHFHLLVLDGAYICRENKRVFFIKYLNLVTRTSRNSWSRISRPWSFVSENVACWKNKSKAKSPPVRYMSGFGPEKRQKLS